jgi:hypothetical protein
MVAYAGKELRGCELWVFSDADFAGEPETQRSTSGCFVALVGPKKLVGSLVGSEPQADLHFPQYF